MAQLARISRAAFRNLPSIFLNENSSTPTATGWLKKVAAPSFFNIPNGAITNPRSTFLPSYSSSSSLHSATSTDKEPSNRKAKVDELENAEIFKDKIRVHVFLPIQGELFSNVKLDTSDSILTVKNAIQEILYVNPEDQVLIYGGKLLEDTRTFSDYDIKQDWAISLFLPKQPGIKEFTEILESIAAGSAFFSNSNLMSSQIPRISTSVRSICRNLPSTFLNAKPNPWMVSRSYSILSKLRLPFLPFKRPFATSKDKEGGTIKGKKEEIQFKKVLFKEMVKILRVLLDYDEPHNHLIDGVKVLSSVLEEWKKLRPNFELDYGVGDLQTPRILSLLSPYLKVDEKATREKISMAERRILTLLLAYNYPNFADVVLIAAMHLWQNLVSTVEIHCIDVWTTNKDKPADEKLIYPFPSVVIDSLKGYKIMMYQFDDPDSLMEEIARRRRFHGGRNGCSNDES